MRSSLFDAGVIEACRQFAQVARRAFSLMILLAATSFSGTPAEAIVLSSGGAHSLGLRANGTVAAWGDNGFGQVSGASTVTSATAISAGDLYSLALRSNGTVAAWGYDGFGQVSGASTVTGATAISAGHYHSLALRSNGTVAAWGNNDYGQVSGASSVTGATAISTGSHHSLVLRANGTVAASGRNTEGQVSGASSVTGATAISAGTVHSLALRSNGTVAAWGHDGYGQVSGPSSVTGATAISAGGYYSLALRSNGTVAAWGLDTFDQVSGASGLSDTVYITAGGAHSYAVRSDGSIVSWGRNLEGQRNTPALQLPTTARWSTGTSGDYLHSHRWHQGIPSTALSDAVFDQSGTYTVGFGNTARARNLNLSAGNVTFNLGAHTYQVQNDINLSGSGALTIGAGGTVTVDQSLNLATGAELNVGVGSSVTVNDEVDINTGTLRVEAGGLVGNTQAFVGASSASTGTVNVAGTASHWNNNEAIFIGYFGNGTLNVEDGGLVSNLNGFIGYHSGSTGDATVTGAGSQWNNSQSLYVGGDSGSAGGTGVLQVFDSGTVSVGDALKIWGIGTLDVSAGSSVTADDVQNDGAIQLDGLLQANTVQGIGSLSGSGTVQANLMLEGLVSPGNSPGELTVDGDLTLASGSSYLFEVNDASGSAGLVSGWDLLSVTGSTLITGTLGDSVLIDLTSLSGTLPGEADNFNATQAYSWELLTSAGGISGFNTTAFTLLTSNFQNDLAGGSFQLVQQGNSLAVQFTPLQANNSAVPEPATASLLFLCLFFCRRRR